MNKLGKIRRFISWPVVVLTALLCLPVSLFLSHFFSNGQKVIIDPGDLLERLDVMRKNRSDIAGETMNQMANEVTLINKLELVAPVSNKTCLSVDPWVAGESEINQDAFLTTDDCFAIRVTLTKEASILIFSLDDKKNISRIFPELCENMAKLTTKKVQQAFQIPQDINQKPGVMFVDDLSEEDNIYVLAMTQLFNFSQYESDFEPLFDTCDNQSVSSDLDYPSRLNKIKNENNSTFDWQKFRIYH